MNIYDNKMVVCATCKKTIGEVDYDALIIRPLCGQCADPIPEGDKIRYTASHYQNKSQVKIPQIA